MKIRNWSKFQHYKYRNPPWIKLYRELLNDPDWFELSGESAKGLMMLWLIASEQDGYLPDSKTLAFRLHISENRIIALLSDCSKWLEKDASNMLATCYQDAIPEYRDRVQRTEEKKEESKTAASQHLVPEVTWFSFVEMRNKIRKPLTEQASRLIQAKLLRLKEQGNDPVEVIEQSVMNGWAGIFEVHGRNGNGRTAAKSFEQIRNEGTDAAIRNVLERSKPDVAQGSEKLSKTTGRADTIDLPRTPTRHPN